MPRLKSSKKKTAKKSKAPAKPKTQPSLALVPKASADTLTLPKGALVTPVALIMPEGFTMNEWKKTGMTIKMLAKGAQWWVGDWLNFGEARYGEKYSQYINDIGLAYGTLANYQSIGGKFVPGRRREELSFGHHESVLALENPDQQDEFLEKAVQESWTREQLRAAIREFNRPADAGPESKRKISIKIEFEDEPEEGSVERLRTSIEKVAESQMGKPGKIVSWSWHY